MTVEDVEASIHRHSEPGSPETAEPAGLLASRNDRRLDLLAEGSVTIE
jgi:hypothetical protein